MVYLPVVRESTFLSTGLTSLDSFLGGGWPAGALSELTGNEGEGKTLVALRTAAQLTRRKQWVALISQGETLFPPAIAAEGIDLPFLLWLRPVETERCRWAAEQVVRSGLFPFVMIRRVFYDERNARRLQLSSESNGTAVLFLSSGENRTNPWAFALRLRIERASLETVRIRLLRSRNLILKTQTEVSLYETDAHPLHPLPELPLARAAS